MGQRLTFYWLPHCSTCQKALKHLETNPGLELQCRDIKGEPLSRDEVVRLAKLAGGADAMFSRRARLYQEMGLATKSLGEAEMLDLMAKEYTFIKRPVLVAGDKAICGFNAKLFDQFLQNL